AWISSSTLAAASTRPEALVLGSGALVSSSVVLLAERMVVWKHVRKQTSSSRTRDFRIMPHLGSGIWILLSYLLTMILFDAGCRIGDYSLGYGGSDQGESGGEAKKCGAESGDPNLRFQPRLPGSVVGEASMRQVDEADKITRVTVPW